MYPRDQKVAYPLPSSIVSGGDIQIHQQQQVQLHPTSAASVNFQSSFTDQNLPVTLTYTFAESKRLVLAFESRIQGEITWALNTLLILSCNTSQNFCLDSQQYLIESLSNYMQFCIERIESLDLTQDAIKKDQKLHITQVNSIVDINSGLGNQQAVNRIGYRNFGMFTRVPVIQNRVIDNKAIIYSDDVAALF